MRYTYEYKWVNYTSTIFYYVFFTEKNDFSLKSRGDSNRVWLAQTNLVIFLLAANNNCKYYVSLVDIVVVCFVIKMFRVLQLTIFILIDILFRCETDINSPQEMWHRRYTVYFTGFPFHFSSVMFL